MLSHTNNSFADAITDGLVEWNLETFVHVPSSHVARIIRGLEERRIPSVLANREDEAMGIAGGLAIGGSKTALVMQDNGFGNALTALTTFLKAYHVGLPIVANTRGGPGEYNSMIHTFSESVPALLSAAGVRVERLGPSDPPVVWRETVRGCAELARTTHRPIVVLADTMHPASSLDQ